MYWGEPLLGTTQYVTTINGFRIIFCIGILFCNNKSSNDNPFSDKIIVFYLKTCLN